jgi:hypothetical protein
MNLGNPVLEGCALHFVLDFAIPEGAFKRDELPLLESFGELRETSPGKDAMPLGAGFVIAFVVLDERCSRRIFTERLPGTVERYARRSSRMRQALTWVSLALGGRASARVAGRLGLPASRATLLRTLRGQSHPATSPSPRVLGVASEFGQECTVSTNK